MIKVTRYILKVKLNGEGSWTPVVTEILDFKGYKFMTFAALEMIRLQSQYPEHEYKICLTV